MFIINNSHKLLLNLILIGVFTLSATLFLLYRALQFDRNYPNPLGSELSANTLKISGTRDTYKCYLKPQIGTCTGYITKYFYNRKTKNCEPYIYSGCGAEAPFATLEQCQAVCTN
jgi:hypothetical protein